MKEKYFCILAYKFETDYKGLSHRQKIWPNNGDIHKRENKPWSRRGGLVVSLLSLTGSFTSIYQPLQNGYNLVFISKRTNPSLPQNYNPKTWPTTLKIVVAGPIQSELYIK
jgi:hypothetical protein